MERNIFVYFGDDLFHKLHSFMNENLPLCPELTKCNIFSSLRSPPSAVIEAIYLGWSYIVYKVGSKLYHVGFPNSSSDSTEVFKGYDKDLTITCGVNEVYAFSSDGCIFYYSTRDLNDTFSYTNNTEHRIKALSTGDCYTVVLYDDGTVSLLKINEKTPLIPLHIKSAIIEIACGKEHVLFLSETGQVFSYGFGSRGQLGHGSIENQDKPMLLEALDGIKIKSISCGGWHSAAVSDAGDLYVWGWNENGQLGFPCAELQSNNRPLTEIETVCCFPKVVDFEDEKQILSVSCGSRHTTVLTEDFEVWSWGWNEYGQLSHYKYPLCDKPCKILFSSTFIPKQIKCAFWSTLVMGTLTV